MDRMSPDLAPHKTSPCRPPRLEWKKAVVGAKVDFQDYAAKSWTSGVAAQEAEEYAAMEQQRWRYQQYPTAAHIKVTVAGLDGRDEESDSSPSTTSRGWLVRLARRRRDAVRGPEHADDPDDPAVFACEHGKAYGCKGLVDASTASGAPGAHRHARQAARRGS